MLSGRAPWWGFALGEALRRAGITAPILVLGGILGRQVGSLLQHDLEITVSSLDKLRQVRPVCRYRQVIPMHDGVDHHTGGGGTEGPAAGEHFIQHDTC